MQNIRPTASLRLRFIWRLERKANGSIRSRASCASAEAETEYAIPWRFMHFPLMSRFQNDGIGLHTKIQTRKTIKLLITRNAREMYATIRNLGVWKISR
jgi:hypothetical protein